MPPPMFADRTDAGRKLAERLKRQRGQHAVVLALPRGGVPVAFEIAQALNAPLDLLFAAKIGAPDQPELAVGAIADGAQPQRVLNDEIVEALNISAEYLAAQADRKLAEIARRRRRYLGDRPRVDLTGRTVILVDDGIATGATVRAALRAARRSAPRRLLLAVPVASPQALRSLAAEVDKIVCLEPLSDLAATSMAYREFPQVSDSEVISLMQRAPTA